MVKLTPLQAKLIAAALLNAHGIAQPDTFMGLNRKELWDLYWNFWRASHRGIEVTFSGEWQTTQEKENVYPGATERN